MIINDKFFEYLSSKIEGFKKTIDKSGRVILLCPNLSQHHFKTKNPTATIIADKIVCPICNFKGSAEDCVRLLEPELKEKSDAEIVQYFFSSTKSDTYKELDEYTKYGWSLVKVAKNGNEGIEKAWQKSNIKDKITWIGWLEAGFNIGARTGKDTGITTIDADLKVAPSGEYEKVYRLLTALNTLRQSTPHGEHFIIQYDPDLPQSQKLAKKVGITIDIRNDCGMFVVAPSKRDGLSYSWKNLGAEIKKISPELKSKLSELLKVEKVDSKKELTSEMKEIIENPIELVGNNLTGCCNDTFVQFGGALLKMGVPTDKIKPILFYLNKNWLKNPMPPNAVDAMLGSLDSYKQTEEQTQEQKILDFAKTMPCEFAANDVLNSCFSGDKNKRGIVNKYLSEFHKQGKLIILKRGWYKFKQQVEWTNEENQKMEEYSYKIPYFQDYAYFNSGDMILIGAFSGKGKTHIAMNFIKQMKEQGIIPYYLSLESGSRHQKARDQLEMTSKDYYTPLIDLEHPPIDNPLQIELVPNAFTIIDWLDVDDFSETQNIFKHLNVEMQRKGGILIVLAQLKEENTWFAPNLIKQRPSFACRYVWDDDSGKTTRFEVDKIRDPRGHYQSVIIPCGFNWETKEIKIKK